MKKLIECVPNFSEGRDMNVIRQITAEIESVDGVKLLDVDPGATTNRTVVTFVGTPDEVLEAAFLAVKKAQQLIDMRKHKGDHPRFGATDVCPLVPISGVTMDEVAEYARKLGKRIGEELGIPVYLYENAASEEERRNRRFQALSGSLLLRVPEGSGGGAAQPRLNQAGVAPRVAVGARGQGAAGEGGALLVPSRNHLLEAEQVSVQVTPFEGRGVTIH